MSNVVFTNKALSKISEHGLSEAIALDVFNKGTVEKWSFGGGHNSVKKYNGYEVGVAWITDKENKYIITSVWKRNNRY